MPTPQLDVYYPDGTTQSFPLSEERVVVGSSPKCQVILDRPEIAAEYMLLSPRPEGCWIALARNVTTPALLDGQPFERGMVDWNRSLIVGSLKLVVSDGRRTRRMSPVGVDGKEKKEGISPVLVVALLVIVPVSLWLIFTDPHAAVQAQVTRTPPPQLFDTAAPPCPVSDPAQYINQGQEESRIALAKAERMPFRTQDGVEAVAYYQRAAACFRAGGDATSAELSITQANQLKVRLEDDYRAHRFRLERALEQERVEDALYEVRVLHALVEHRRGPYLTALQTLERQLNLRIDQASAAAR